MRGAAGQAEENRLRAEASETRANGLEKQKADVEFTLSKTNEEVKRLKQTESEAKAALAAAETRLADLGEQLKKALLRRAALAEPGPKRLAAHPGVIHLLERHPDWLDTLASQVGGSVSLRADPSLTISAGYAEAG